MKHEERRLFWAWTVLVGDHGSRDRNPSALITRSARESRRVKSHPNGIYMACTPTLRHCVLGGISGRRKHCVCVTSFHDHSSKTRKLLTQKWHLRQDTLHKGTLNHGNKSTQTYKPSAYCGDLPCAFAATYFFFCPMPRIGHRSSRFFIFFCPMSRIGCRSSRTTFLSTSTSCCAHEGSILDSKASAEHCTVHERINTH